jgi:hypothetical protein
MQYPVIAQPQYAFAPSFAEGGLTRTAQAVQSRGRGDDKMLVHMTPGEVGGLQALAMANGGSLTINPATGLPEASFLKRLLPTLIGAGLSFIPGVGPLMAAGMVGGFETLRTGDLSKGLMAGLGAYGGAGLGSALSSAGAAAGASGAGTAGTLGSTAASSAVPGSFQASLADLGVNAASAAPASLVPGTSTAALQSAISAPAPSFMGNLAQAGQGLSSLNTAQGWSNLGSGLQTAFPSTTAKVAAATPAVSELAYQFSPKPPEITNPEESEYKGPYKPTERQVRYPTLDELRSSREFSYFSPSNPMPFAKGGSVPMLEDGGFVLTKKAVDGIGKGDNKRGQKVASAGLGALPIKGKGTGTSDSIKTSIDGKIPARVSNGEAYVPKRNVNKAGGAKKLYALMRNAERRA